MGPKKDKKKADKGKKGVVEESNEQLKQQKFEADKKRREEELVKHTEELKKQEETYKKQLQLKKVYDEQIQQSKDTWKRVEEKVDTYKKDFRSSIWWEKYIKNPTVLPNPLVPKEVYDYIASLENTIKPIKLESSVQRNNEALQLIYDIKYTENLHEDKTSLKKSWKEQIATLEHIMEENLKMAIIHLLTELTRHINKISGNVEYYAKTDHTTLCVWGNMSKINRSKSFEFAEGGIKFELPKNVVALDCLIQLLHTDYDHLSHYCHTYINKSKPKYEEPEQFVKKPTPAVVEVDVGGGLNVASAIPPADGTALPTAKVQADGDNEGVSERVDEKSQSNLDSEEVDLNEFTPLGGVWYIHLLTMPPQAQGFRPPPGLKILEELPYDFPPFSGSATSRESNDGERYITISIQMPDAIVWNETLGKVSVAQWDNNRKYWSRKTVFDANISEEKTVSFKLGSFAPVSLIQFKHITLPYQSWVIRPIDKDLISITVNSGNINAVFHIQKHLCSLLQITNNNVLVMQHLCKKNMAPHILLKEMQKFGVNFFPDHDSYKYLKPDYQVKDWNMESNFYQNVSLICNAYEVGSSHWLKNTTTRNSVIRIKEFLSPTIKGNERVVKCSLQQAVILKISEGSAEFSEEELPDQAFSADLYHLILSSGSDEAKKQIMQCSDATKEGVYEILTCLKPLSFCQ